MIQEHDETERIEVRSYKLGEKGGRRKDKTGKGASTRQKRRRKRERGKRGEEKRYEKRVKCEKKDNDRVDRTHYLKKHRRQSARRRGPD